MELECTECRYRFKRERTPSRCPYCSEEGSIAEVKPAQDYINDYS